MSHEPSPDVHMEAPLGQLERALIDEYVRSRGYDPAQLDALPAGERDDLLKAASIHASAKLSEVEARSHLLKDLHDGAPRTSQTGLE